MTRADSNPNERPPSSGMIAILVDAHRVSLSRLAYLLTGHHAVADDAVVGAFGEIGASVCVEADSESLLTASLHLAVVRHAVVLAEHLDPTSEPDFWRSGAWALQRLPVDQRAVIALRVCPGLDESEIARLLRLPVSAVHSRVRDGLAALTRHLNLDPARPDAVLAAVRLVARGHDGGQQTAPPVPRGPQGGTGATGPVISLAEAAAATVAALGIEPVTTGLNRAAAVRSVTPLVAGATFVLVVAGLAVTAVAAPALLRLATGGKISAPAVPAARGPGIAGPVPGAPAPAASGPVSTPRAGSAESSRNTLRLSGPSRRPVAGTVPAAASEPPVGRSPAGRSTAPQPSSAAPSAAPGPAPRPVPDRGLAPAPQPADPGGLPADLLRARSSGLCLDVPGGAVDGTQVRLAGCRTDAGQAITESDSTFRLGGRCLYAARGGTGPGTPVVVVPCTSAAGQLWDHSDDGSLRNTDSGLCLSAAGGGRTAGTEAVLEPCDGRPDQGWLRTR